MFRPAQTVAIAGAIDQRLGAIGPQQPPQAAFIHRAHGRMGGNAEQARFALDHHAARFGGGGRHQRNARTRHGFRQCPHPFRAGTRLAKAAPSQQQPDAPITGRRALIGAPPFGPIGQIGRRRRLAQPRQPARAPGGWPCRHLGCAGHSAAPAAASPAMSAASPCAAAMAASRSASRALAGVPPNAAPAPPACPRTAAR